MDSTSAGDDSVTLTRDRWGIGHVTAPDSEAAFAGQGWVAAADRMWQMEWDRRRALGRWSEVIGETGLRDDRLFRRLDLAAVARRDFDLLQPDTQAMCRAYATGVNRWLDANGDNLPPEFEHHPAPPEPWEPWHCLAVYKVRHFFMGTIHRKVFRAWVAATADAEQAAAIAIAMAGPLEENTPMVVGIEPALDLDAGVLDALAHVGDDLIGIVGHEVEGGSNSWAVAGSQTSSGTPLLAGDPHRGIEFPNVYHQCHVACDEFDAIGLAFPGVPGFAHFGHNESVAWCITHGMADDTDLFVHRALPGEPTRVETIHVAGAEPETLRCYDTDAGPVVFGDPEQGPVVSLRWTGITFGATANSAASDTTLDSLLPMLLATDTESFRQAVRPWVIPVNNVLTADTDGHIAFHLRGRLVERSAQNRWFPVPAQAEFAWGADVDFDALHHVRDPDSGFLATANSRISDGGPYVSVDYADPARHDRLLQLLDGRTDLGRDDMTAIHNDVHSLVAPDFLRLLAGAPGIDDDPSWPLLADWDCEVSRTSIAASLYESMLLELTHVVGERLGLGSLTGAMNEPGWPDVGTSLHALQVGAINVVRFPTDASAAALGDPGPLALEALRRGRAKLEAAHGTYPTAWEWGRIHQIFVPHPLATALPAAADLAPAADTVPGDSHTIRCAALHPLLGFGAALSSAARYCFDPGDWDASGWVVPHGVSGVPGGGHDHDQRTPWLEGTLLPMAYSADAVAAVAVDTVTLDALAP